MKYIFSVALTLGLISQNVVASDILKDFDSLSGNDVLLERAKALNPTIKTAIVQNRAVERPGRIEFSPEYSNVFGGDAYVKTQMIGLNAHYHLNYRWSLALKYGYAFNELSAEGENLLKNQTLNAVVPSMDHIKQETLASVNWYPIYGKFSLYDMGIVHFDIYALAGAGQITLESGTSQALSAGGGFSFWFSRHLTSRFEVRWMGYEAQRTPGRPEDMNLTVGSLSVGYLL